MRVLDTDICIEILHGNPVVLERRASIEDEIRTTWITASELMYGAAKSRSPETNRSLATALLHSMEALGIELSGAEIFGSLKASLEVRGHRLPDADLLIAAITLAHGAILVTGNTRHFARIPGLVTEDWIRGS